MPSTFVIAANRIAETLHCDDRGATALEYALMAALIAAVIVGAVTALGLKVNTMFTNLVNAL